MPAPCSLTFTLMKNKFKFVVFTSTLFVLILIFGTLAYSITSSTESKSSESLSLLERDFLSLKTLCPPTDHSDYDQSTLAWDNGRNYGIFIDAGSSGSRIYVYSWLDPSLASHLASDSTIKIEKADSAGVNFELKEEPGISAFTSNPSGVGPHLDPLLSFASRTIPNSKQKSTPIFLFATAGMRLVEPGQQNEILKEACRYVKNGYRYFVKDCDSHFRVISGELEGIFGWLTVNYLKTRFKGTDDEKRGETIASSFGFIDMGGASAQIAFEPTAPMTAKHENDVQKVVIRKLNRNELVKSVFVTTFLGYGANQARDRYVDLYTTPSQTSFTDPCLNSGLEFPSGSVFVAGSGDFDQCLTKLSPLLNLDLKCTDDPCLFNGVHAPIEDFTKHHFLGVSELWYTTAQAYDLGGIYDYAKMYDASEKLCKTPWSEISEKVQEKKYPNIDSLSRMKLKCFKSAYLLKVLHEGLRIPKSASPASEMLETLEDLEGFSVTWTLGAAFLLASSQIDTHHHIAQLSHRFTSVLLILLIMLAAGFYYFVSKARGGSSAYTDISRFHSDVEQRISFSR